MVRSSDLERPSTRWRRFSDRIVNQADVIALLGRLLAILCGLYAIFAFLVLVDTGSHHEVRLTRVLSSAPVVLNPRPDTTYVFHEVLAEGQLPDGTIVQQPISIHDSKAGHFTVYTRTTGHRLEVGADPLPNRWHHWHSGLAALIAGLVLCFGRYALTRAARARGFWI